jgi:serine/threonine protein kinase
MGSTASTHPSPKRRLGDFEIVRELGRGGMGIVYEARQVSLNRKVALKVLSGSLGLTSKAVIRFQREAEAAAKLHHTNIVPIYATGEQDGTHYYAMELIEGPSLDQVIAQMREAEKAQPASQPQEPAAASPTAGPAGQTAGPFDWAAQTIGFEPPNIAAPDTPSETRSLSSSSLQSGGSYFDTVAKLMAEVADALDYAHAQGVIHRDIKPSNLLLSPVGRLSMNDFGLARMLEQPGMTVSGEFVGSPMYMSPEQIAVGRAPLDHRTDIYSLGATLYEMLTLQAPFQGVRRDQVIGQIMHKEPKALRSVNRKVPQDLETICLKAMEKDPDKRYQTAGDMAKDLRAYVSRFAISARRVGPVGRCIRWARRSKAMAAALGGLLMLGLLAGVFAYREHRAQQQVLEKQRELLDRQRELLEEQREQVLEHAIAAALSGDYEQAKQDIFDAERKGASPGRIRLLEGLLAWRKEEYGEAETKLKQARDLMPDSVAPIALLVQVYGSSGQGEKWNEMLAQLEANQPKTAEDFLFKGISELNDPEKQLQDLNSAARLRNSAVVREQREYAEQSLAIDTRDLKTLDLALADAEVAERELPGDPNTLSMGLWTRLFAAIVYEKTNHPDKHKRMMDEAGKIIEELGDSRYSDSIQCHVARLWYFEYSRNTTAIGREVEQLIRLNEPDAWGLKAMELVRVGNMPDAIAMANEARTAAIKPTWTWCLAGIILADQDPKVARELTQDAAARRTGGLHDLYPPQFLRLFGSKSEAEEAARALRQRKPRWPWRGGWYEKVLDLECGDISAEALLKRAGTSQWNLGEANFLVAMTCLADGDRDEAKKRFQAVMDTGLFGFVVYAYSDLILIRMRQDPNWPRWIPASTTRLAVP